MTEEEKGLTEIHYNKSIKEAINSTFMVDIKSFIQIDEWGH